MNVHAFTKFQKGFADELEDELVRQDATRRTIPRLSITL